MTMHQKTTFRQETPISETTMRSWAPSIFATERYEGTSEKFKVIPTIDVLRELEKEGFQPFMVRQSNARKDENRHNFTRHIIRLRHIDSAMTEKYKVGDNLVEIVLRNANDGTSSYELFSGLFRIRCLNGLVACTNLADRIRVRHNGKEVVKDVVEGTYRVLSQSEKILTAPQEWSKITLNRENELRFGERVRTIRFGDKDGVTDTPFTAEDILTPRRQEDAAKDLWSLFNVAQENCLRGGMSAIRPARIHNGRMIANHRMVHTRDISNVDRDIKLNIALWALGEETAKELA